MFTFISNYHKCESTVLKKGTPQSAGYTSYQGDALIHGILVVKVLLLLSDFMRTANEIRNSLHLRDVTK